MRKGSASNTNCTMAIISPNLETEYFIGGTCKNDETSVWKSAGKRLEMSKRERVALSEANMEITARHKDKPPRVDETRRLARLNCIFSGNLLSPK